MGGYLEKYSVLRESMINYLAGRTNTTWQRIKYKCIRAPLDWHKLT